MRKRHRSPRLRPLILLGLLIGICLGNNARADTYGFLVTIGSGKAWPSRYALLPSVKTDLFLWKDMLSIYRQGHLYLRVLQDSDDRHLPTLFNVLAGFRWLEQRVKPTDNVFIAFSCHETPIADTFEDLDRGIVRGDEVDDMNDQAILLYDSDPDNKPLSCLIDDEIGYHLRRIHSKRVVCLFDTCHARGTEKGPRHSWAEVLRRGSGVIEKGPVRASADGPVIIAASDDTGVPQMQLRLARSLPRLDVSPCSLFLWATTTAKSGITFNSLGTAIGDFYVACGVQSQGIPVQPSVYGAPTVNLNQPFLWVRKPDKPSINATAGELPCARPMILRALAKVIGTTSARTDGDRKAVLRTLALLRHTLNDKSESAQFR